MMSADEPLDRCIGRAPRSCWELPFPRPAGHLSSIIFLVALPFKPARGTGVKGEGARERRQDCPPHLAATEGQPLLAAPENRKTLGSRFFLYFERNFLGADWLTLFAARSAGRPCA